MSENLQVGSKCHVDGRRAGTIRYVGETSFASGQWVGVELGRASGLNDGSVQGARYFRCPPKCGVFVRPERVTNDEATAASSMIQAAARGLSGRCSSRRARAVRGWNTVEGADELDHLHTSTRKVRSVEKQLRGRHRRPHHISTDSSSSSSSSSPLLVDDPLYRGPHLRFPVTRRQALEVLRHFRRSPGVPLHKTYVTLALRAFVDLMRTSAATEAVVDVDVPPAAPSASNPGDKPNNNHQVVVVGDTHGQLQDFLFILQHHGLPSRTNVYLVNGDIADRGAHACEIFLALALFKLSDPACVHLNRGNHENAEMNLRDVSYGGGFAHEVSRKYGGRTFQLFQEAFCSLPLATVLGGKVLVVHGGLPRQRSARLAHWRKVNHRRQCPEDAATMEDSIFFDACWADPCEQRGVNYTSGRGPGCVNFGPDVTSSFLERNGLDLLIRSHEVPHGSRGYMSHHGGRCYTIFSASNYCGRTGNYGSVALFFRGDRQPLEFKIQEHFAPPLEELARADFEGLDAEIEGLAAAALSSSPPPPPPPPSSALLGQKPPHASSSEGLSQTERMEADIFERVRERIAIKKPELEYFWSHEECTTAGDGECLISMTSWKDGLQAALPGLGDLPYLQYKRELCGSSLRLVDSVEGGTAGKCFKVDFRLFLRRYFFDTSSLQWVYAVGQAVYSCLLAADLSADAMADLFDSKHDGVVSPAELHRAFVEKLHCDITPTQAEEVIRHMTADSQAPGEGGVLPVMEFLSRFVVTYGGRTKGPSASRRPRSPEVESLLSEVGRAIILAWGGGKRHGGSGGGIGGNSGVAALPEVFQVLDTDHNGYLSIDELKRGLRALPIVSSVSEALLDELVAHIDADGNGRVNLLEFLSAFSVADKVHHRSPLVSGARPSADCTAAAAAAAATPEEAPAPSGVCDEIIQRALALLFSHKGLLRKCFAHFDAELAGTVSPADFREALRVFSEACASCEGAAYGEPLNERQMDVMAANMNRDAGGRNVNYEEFLSSLRVVSLP